MKRKIWLLWALFPYCLWGQSLFEDSNKTVECYLYRENSKAVTRLFDQRRGIFPMDTVPVQELKDNYAARNQKDWPDNVYEGKDSVASLWTGLMVQSVLKTCPVKSAQDLRAVWGDLPLHLKAVLNPDGTENTSVYKKLQKKAGSEHVLPYWYDGMLTFLKKPARYWNFVVSSDASFYRWINGKVIPYSYRSPSYPDYFSYVGCRILDGFWHDYIDDGMHQLAAEINATPDYARRNRNDAVLEFVFILLIDNHQKCHIELLEPQQLDGRSETDFYVLEQFFKKLQPGLFQCLYTSDGRIFPARYIRARLDSRGWQFEDLLQVTSE